MLKYIALFIEDAQKTSHSVITSIEEGLENLRLHGFNDLDDDCGVSSALIESVQGLESYAFEKQHTVRELRYRVGKCQRFLDNVSWNFRNQGTLFDYGYTPRLAEVTETKEGEEPLPIELVGKVGDLLALYDRQGDKTDLVEVADGDELRVVTSIQKQVHFMMQHGERLVCDNQIYLKSAGQFEII